MRKWFLRNIPDWADFQVVPRAKYLGFYLGPTANQIQWAGVFANYADRVNKIANLHAPTSVSISLYNSHAVSLINYVAQLVPLPVRFATTERRALFKLLHLATSAVSGSDLFNLYKFNQIPIRSCVATAHASMIRTALSTVSQF